MKCDGLKPLVFSIVDLAYIDEIRATRNFQIPNDHAVYKATEVDEAIAELKQKLHDAEMRADLAEAACTEYREDIKRLKATPQQIMKEVFDKVLIYPKEMVHLDDAYILAVSLRQTLRALWLARVENARNSAFICWNRTESGWQSKYEKWKKVERLCRAKADTFKEAK